MYRESGNVCIFKPPEMSIQGYYGEWVHNSAILFLTSLLNGVQLSTLLHSEWPKLHRVLATLSATGLKEETPLGTYACL